MFVPSLIFWIISRGVSSTGIEVLFTARLPTPFSAPFPVLLVASLSTVWVAVCLIPTFAHSVPIILLSHLESVDLSSEVEVEAKSHKFEKRIISAGLGGSAESWVKHRLVK